jgi:hypothetical protein
MTTQPVPDGTAAVVPESQSLCRADANPGVNATSKPTSSRPQQGDLPDLASLQMIIDDPVTACHGPPIQQPSMGAKPEGVQDEQVEDAAVSHAEKEARNEDVNATTSTPRYRPAYELADASHERLGRGTQPPVLTAK